MTKLLLNIFMQIDRKTLLLYILIAYSLLITILWSMDIFREEPIVNNSDTSFVDERVKEIRKDGVVIESLKTQIKIIDTVYKLQIKDVLNDKTPITDVDSIFISVFPR